MLSAEESCFFAEWDAQQDAVRQQKEKKIVPVKHPSQFACPVCKQNNVSDQALHDRRQDESHNTLCRCRACGHQFKVRT